VSTQKNGGVGGTMAKSHFDPNKGWRMNVKTGLAIMVLAGMTGQATAAIDCTDMADAATGKRLVRQGQCYERVTSGSTFKIAISLMGFDSGILRDAHAPTLPFKKGYVDWIPSWRTATDPTSWMKNSVVWYSQQTTTRLGAARVQRYADSFNFGNHDLSGDPGKNNGLTLSWISSSLKISPDEQVAFLTNVVNRKFPLTPHAYAMTAQLLKQTSLANGWEIYGKTGSGSPVLPDGTQVDGHDYGWFVGWATKGTRTIVFARLVQDEKPGIGRAGLRVRDAFLRELPARLDAL
jgi:bla regulator protein BlaR1